MVIKITTPDPPTIRPTVDCPRPFVFQEIYKLQAIRTEWQDVLLFGTGKYQDDCPDAPDRALAFRTWALNRLNSEGE